MGLAVDYELRGSGLDADGADHAAVGYPLRRHDLNGTTEQAVGLEAGLARLKTRQVCLHRLRGLERAELRHLCRKIAIADRIHGVLRR